MKLPRHIKEAEIIGNETWELQHFMQLKNATKKRQIEALKLDQKWMHDHVNRWSAQIDYLIQAIERET